MNIGWKMDINTFGEMLLSSHSKSSKTPTQNSSKDAKDIVGLLQSRNFYAVENLVPKISKKEVNTTAVMVALVENFDCGIANLLCEKGLDLNRLIGPSGLLVCAPTAELWDWLMGSDASNDVYENILNSVFSLLNDPMPVNDPRRTSSAQFACLVKKYNPQLFKDVVNYASIESCVIGNHPQNIHSDQWDMLQQCLDKTDWKNVIWEIDPCTIKDFENLVHACQRVSALNNLYSERFGAAKKMHDWKIKNLVSASGNIKDCALILSLPDDRHIQTTQAIKRNIDKRFEQWGCSELEMIILSTRDPSDANESSNTEVLQNLYHSAGHHNFLHMMISQMGAKFAKGIHKNSENEQQIFETLNAVDCHMFAKTSTITDLNDFFKMFPKMVEWKDVAGNHLGHYIAQSAVLSSSMLDLLMKHHTLCRPNPYGVSPRDILQHRTGAKNLEKFDQMISQYDKKMLQQSLKDDTHAGLKLRSQKAPTRKM